jgi:hypothetical protein
MEFKNVFPIFCMIIAIFLGIIFFLLLFEKQNQTYKDISCERLKECIFLEVHCLEENINNKLFNLEWNFTQYVNMDESRIFYKENCLK